MSKQKECPKCGVARKLQVKAKVHELGNTYSLKRLCFPCFLMVCNLFEPGSGKILDYSKIMDSYDRDERFNELQKEPL